MTEKQAEPIVEKLHEADRLVRSAIEREPRNFELQDCKIAIWNALDKVARATTESVEAEANTILFWDKIQRGTQAVTPLCTDSPDGNHHVAPIGSDEEYLPSKAPCYYCGEKQAS